ncbi:restriction endonuclease subunit S [Novosphingobium sp. MD-1]|uniref:restriction endonuclease subunit S n=1 Tax=Novosphingobium sp. MD-1 TaxID=1630648 RepID=UPI001F242EFE|nr:restriction endonuclease subunit S [Novosphingobium sp. MD-1]
MTELERDVTNLPNGWRRVRLGAVFAERKEKGRVGLPVASVSIEHGLVLRSSLDRRVASDLPPEGHALVRKGDIAYNMMRMWQGACGLAEADCIISPAYVVMTPSADVEPVFAHIALRSEPMMSLLHGYSQGIVDDRLRLYSDAFAQVPINLPPLDEQRRIAEVLRAVDEAIAANRAALDQVARARAAILHSAFEETVWEPVALGELGSWQSGGTPSKDDESKWGGDVPWVCPRDMKTPVIRQTHSTLTPLALGGSCKLAPKGTLMIVVRGMILAKAIPTATTAMDATFNQDMKAFRPNGRALPKFVQLCLQHQERQLLRVVNTATHGTKKLDTDTLLTVSVPLPNLETQQALADAVSDLDFASVKYGEEHIRLSTIKQALMSDLLSGRVRVPENRKTL